MPLEPSAYERPDLRPARDFFRPRVACGGTYPGSSGNPTPCGLGAEHPGGCGPALSWSEYRTLGRDPIHAEACRPGSCFSYCACYCHDFDDED